MSVIVDAGPLIKGTPLDTYSLLTTPEILEEVRDKAARKSLSLRLHNIETTSATEEDIELVLSLSRQTGDLPSLSENDIKLLALAFKVYREAGVSLRQTIEEVRSNQNAVKGWDSWAGPEVKPPAHLMTFDFAMQNVAIQAGVKVLSVKGLEIKFTKKWVLKCRACKEIEEKIDKEFCERCGNHTLYKISQSINEHGEKEYHEPKRKKGLQGTIYSIPMPKGGKSNQDIILREDQLYMMGGRQYKWNWKKPEVYDVDSVESFNMQIKKKCPYKYGHARKNPNEPVSKKKKR